MDLDHCRMRRRKKTVECIFLGTTDEKTMLGTDRSPAPARIVRHTHAVETRFLRELRTNCAVRDDRSLQQTATELSTSQTGFNRKWTIVLRLRLRSAVTMTSQSRRLQHLLVLLMGKYGGSGPHPRRGP